LSLYSDSAAAPSIFDYRKRGLIAEKDRCKVCDGLGKFLSAHALRGGNIYKKCGVCHGTGRKML